MTFLILFVSTLGMISVTYYLAVERVNSQSQTIKIATAKQDFFYIEQDIAAVLWQPGSARNAEVSDSGGKLNIEPTNGSVTISISDDLGINATVYSQITGWIRYELPYSDTYDTGLYLKGDSRTVTNQSGASVAQLYIETGEEHAEIRLHYRPLVSYVTTGSESNRPVNNIRIYIVNMNSSDTVSLYGKLPLRISCDSTEITSTTYTATYPLDTLTISSVLDNNNGETWVPISSTADGAIIIIEVVECNIKILRGAL